MYTIYLYAVSNRQPSGKIEIDRTAIRRVSIVILIRRDWTYVKRALVWGEYLHNVIHRNSDRLLKTTRKVPMGDTRGARGSAAANNDHAFSADAKDPEKSVNNGTDTELAENGANLLPGPSTVVADEVWCEHDISVVINAHFLTRRHYNKTKLNTHTKTPFYEKYQKTCKL